ncbi:MAG: methyl-accepting chemotaxis protein [Candidatus Aureabacteria bacterium]|nr:methyl-accepting chemotaxis protein [Candidatus Auribacterota bacterium]
MQRKKLIVDWNIQFRFMLIFIIPVLIFSGLGFILIHKMGGDSAEQSNLYFQNQLDSLQEIESFIVHSSVTGKDKILNLLDNQKIALNELRGHVIRHWEKMSGIITLCFIAVIIVSAIMGLIISHRIFGPFKRLRSNLEIMADGDLSKKMSVRKTDQFRDLLGAIETMRQNIHESIDEYDKTLEAVSRFVEKIELDLPNKEGCSEIVKSLEDLKKELKTHDDRSEEGSKDA